MKQHMRHFRVFSFIKDSLLVEVDEWREYRLSRLFAKRDPSVSDLMAAGVAEQTDSKKKKRVLSVIAAVVDALLILGGIGAFFALRGDGQGGIQGGAQNGSSSDEQGGTQDGATPHVHSLTTITKEATCTEWGYIEEVCADEACDYRKRIEETAPKGHTERVTDGKAPSYTEAGYTEKVDCSVCGSVLRPSEVIPVLTHSFAVRETVAPTCTEAGYTLYACTDKDCTEEYKDDYVKATGHTNGTPVRENEILADCAHGGSYDETVYCARCPALLSTRHVTTPHTHGVQTLTRRGGDCTAGSGYVAEDCLACGEECSRAALSFPARATHSMVNGACADCGMPESSAGLEYEYVTGKNEVRVTGIGSCTETDIVIGVINGYTVSEVQGFEENKRIKTVTLADGVRTVGRIAFLNCTALRSVTMGEGVTTISESAFYGCTALPEITLGKNVEVIGPYAFVGCTGITGTLVIPESVREISYNSFEFLKVSAFEVASGNASYASVDGNLYSKDGKSLIKYASGKKETRFVLPEGVESIGVDAIVSGTLTEIVLPVSVRYIALGGISSSALSSLIFGEPSGWETIFYEPIDSRNLSDPQIAARFVNDCDVGLVRVEN